MTFRYFSGLDGSITGALFQELLSLVPAVVGAPVGGLVWPDSARWTKEGVAPRLWLFGIPALTADQMAHNYLAAHPDKNPADAELFVEQAEELMNQFELTPDEAAALLSGPDWAPPESTP